MTATPDSLSPADEAERLRTLRHYDILHSLHEQVFDEFVGLTAHIFSLPISLIALVDEEEVVYKAAKGLPDLTSQPRIAAVCAIAVRQNKAVVFTDLSHDEQLRLTAEADAASRAQGLRFYAGSPLRMPNQRSIGTLCIIDREPRLFSSEEQLVLDQLAALVSQTIAVRHYCLNSVGLGEDHWQRVSAKIVEEVQGLVALVRYLVTRYGTQVPVPQTVLDQVVRRLSDLRSVLAKYQQMGE